MRYIGVATIVVLLVTPALGHWYEPFNYPPPPYPPDFPWDYGFGNGIEFVSNAVRIGLGGTAYTITNNFGATIHPETGDNVICTLFANPGVSSGSNIWSAWFNDSLGNNYARWYGSGNTARPRIDGFGLVLAPVTLVADTWNELKVVVNESAGTSTFYHNGTNLGSLNYSISGATGGVYQAQLENMGRTDVPNDYIMIDDMSVIPEPATLSLLLLGLLLLRRRG